MWDVGDLGVGGITGGLARFSHASVTGEWGSPPTLEGSTFPPDPPHFQGALLSTICLNA